MNKIFRYTGIGFLLITALAVGSTTSYAQDACADGDGQSAANDNITALFKDRTVAGRKAYVAAGKAFLEKYGACESAKLLADYLKPRIPKEEENIRKMEEAAAKEALYARFNDAVKAKNWDATYASGKEILAKEPDQLDLMITLGSIGYDELYEGRTTFKYNDDTIRFAKQAIGAIESGKTSPKFGLFGWAFGNKERAIAELNLTIGYIMQVAQKNKAGAAPYLYKVTQSPAPETAKNPIPYELIGYFYFDELDKLTAEIKTMADAQKPEDTPEVAKTKVDAIKAKVALANGTSERAIEAFSRAYTLGSAKPYKDKMYANIKGAYKLRFAKEEGLDAFIAEAGKKPFQNPLTPVTPISDPEPVTTTTSTTPPAPAPTKPVASTVIKPGTK